MNLQERVTYLMFAESDRVLSRVTPRFFALWEGDRVVNHDGDVLEWAGLPWEEEQLRLVKV
jgi:hypothetical protein